MAVVPASATPTGRRHKARRRHQPMAEINVTPFVDVMLVLLIVFMVSAPLLTVGVPVDLPRANAEAISADNEPLNLTVRAGGKIFLQEAEVSRDELAGKIKALMQIDPERRIIISGDRNADYGTVASVFALLKEAGVQHAMLQTKALGESDN